MAKQQIITGSDNPILRNKSKAVKKIDPKIKKIITALKNTLEANSGLGLAAPQIGKNIRIILVRLNSGKSGENNLILINPEISSCSEEQVVAEEGCLSLPGQFLNVSRSKEITVSFLSEKGIKQKFKLEYLNARVTQHEIDHLEGVLIVDKAVQVQI